MNTEQLHTNISTWEDRSPPDVAGIHFVACASCSSCDSEDFKGSASSVMCIVP